MKTGLLLNALDDVEGFMGLEEIDDVEVFRDNGILKFKVGSARKKIVARNSC